MMNDRDVAIRSGVSVAAFKQYANELRVHARYGILRWRSRDDRPSLSNSESQIVRDLVKSGAHVTTLDALSISDSRSILSAGDAIQSRLSELPVKSNDFTVSADQAVLAQHPALVWWGLNERILSIVGAYIGLPIAYRGLTARRDIVGGPLNATRMWHRDSEDDRIVKVIVYLNDIGEDGGPFEYIPQDKTPASWRVPYVSSSRVTDEAMERLVPRKSWHSCTGPRGTVVVVDTCRVFHRGKIAVSNDRRTLFYCYNSRVPANPQWCAPLIDRQRFLAACPDLTSAQRAAVEFSY